jgi:hypothetical protein
MIDIWAEDLLDVTEAAKAPAFMRAGRPIHVATLWRYAARGVKSRSGERVKLETVRTPSGTRTSRQAIERFVERLNAETLATAIPGQVASAHVRATHSLAAAGL